MLNYYEIKNIIKCDIFRVDKASLSRCKRRGINSNHIICFLFLGFFFLVLIVLLTSLFCIDYIQWWNFCKFCFSV